jgi:hypothetical protein
MWSEQRSCYMACNLPRFKVVFFQLFIFQRSIFQWLTSFNSRYFQLPFFNNMKGEENMVDKEFRNTKFREMSAKFRRNLVTKKSFPQLHNFSHYANFSSLATNLSLNSIDFIFYEIWGPIQHLLIDDKVQ